MVKNWMDATTPHIVGRVPYNCADGIRTILTPRWFRDLAPYHLRLRLEYGWPPRTYRWLSSTITPRTPRNRLNMHLPGSFRCAPAHLAQSAWHVGLRSLERSIRPITCFGGGKPDDFQPCRRPLVHACFPAELAFITQCSRNNSRQRFLRRDFSLTALSIYYIRARVVGFTAMRNTANFAVPAPSWRHGSSRRTPQG